jgi:hypothetical protein
MSFLKRYCCDSCKFELYDGRIICPCVRKPAGWLQRLFGIKYIMQCLPDPAIGGPKINENSIRYMSPIYCFSCRKIRMIEIDKIKHCPICRGTAIFHVDDMVGKDCPKCLSGKILDNIYAIT